MGIYLSGKLKVFLEFVVFPFLSQFSENFLSLPVPNKIASDANHLRIWQKLENKTSPKFL
jgi:hypothetical protein